MATPTDCFRMDWGSTVYRVRGQVHNLKIQYRGHQNASLRYRMYRERSQIASFLLAGTTTVLTAIRNQERLRWAAPVASGAMAVCVALNQYYMDLSQAHRDAANVLKPLADKAHILANQTIYNQPLDKVKDASNALQMETTEAYKNILVVEDKDWEPAKTDVHGPRLDRSKNEWTEGFLVGERKKCDDIADIILRK